jgi:aryl-alcohol dehydrogenase-like predicted oxidoreductase
MKFRRLGSTDLKVSVVGFGGWAIGGDRNASGSMGPSDDAEALASIKRAVEMGVNWIDTAPGYGAGHSEDLIGQAIRGLSEPPMVFTKCGFVWDERYWLTNEISGASIRREAEQSLRRLGLETIDLYQIHWVEPELDPGIEEAWSTLADLKGEGKVRHIGVSNFTVSQLMRANRIAAVETLQPPYSLLERRIETEILPYCKRAGMGVVVYSPMQSGLLTGAMTRERIESLPASDARLIDDPNFSPPRLEPNLRRVDELSRLAKTWGWTPGEVAVAWTLHRDEVQGAIVGFRRPAQVDGVLGRGHLDLDADQLAAVEAIGW